MFDIIRYSADKADEWNAFVAASKNGTFLFDRRYMDYHSDRFLDHSLMFYEKGKLYAVMPANDDKHGSLCSHQGLTYGGLIMDKVCRAAKVRDLFLQMNDFLRDEVFHRVVYKHIPYIYSSLPAEEDLFALTNVCGATIQSRDVASVVDLHRRLPLSELRRRGIKKAVASRLQVIESTDYTSFWDVLSSNLMERFHASPVHSLSEIELLSSRFPQNIKLYVVTDGEEVIGGTVLYISADIVKTQYISTNDRGRKVGALDYLFSCLLDKYKSEGFRFFDFGTSNRVDTDDLNDPLIFQKEGFGGRAVCYDHYEWRL